MKYFIPIFIAFLSQLTIDASGQTADEDEPIAKVGEPLSAFTLTEVFNFKKNYYKSGEPTGKWTILDFWSTGCPSCITGFPKLNELHRMFKDQLDVIIIGKPDKYIRKMYTKLSAHYQMDLPYTFDSTVFKILQLHYLPYSLIVDPNGIVRSIPYPQDLDSTILASLFTGKEVNIRQIKDFISIAASKDIKYMDSVEHRQDSINKVTFRSELSFASYNMPIMKGQEDFTKNKWSYYRRNGINIYCMDLGTLYQIAYTGRTFFLPEDSLFGKVYRNRILETKDSIKFGPSSAENPFLYNYSLRVPEALCTDSFLMKMMQKDLDQYFGYDFHLETRMMPYYALEVKTGTLKKIRTKGGPPEATATNGTTGFTLKNQPMSVFFNEIWRHFQIAPEIIDETGVTKNIDVTIDGILTEIPSLTEALQKAGFDLVPKKKLMTVMVVRDRDRSPVKSNKPVVEDAKYSASNHL